MFWSLILNDDGDDNVKTKWDDPGQWWTIDQFTKEFIAYEFIIKTSRNHQILKGDRVARPKFHIYMPLGRIIENIDTHQDLLDRMKWYTRRLEGEEYLYRLDSKVKNTHPLYGSDVSSVYYNQGMKNMVFVGVLLVGVNRSKRWELVSANQRSQDSEDSDYYYQEFYYFKGRIQ